MDNQANNCQMDQVLDCVRNDLSRKQPKKFKTFLEVMEQSGDPCLKNAAKKLG